MAAHCEKRRDGKKNPESKVININLNLNAHQIPTPRASPRPGSSRSASKGRPDPPPKYEDVIHAPPHSRPSRESACAKHDHPGHHHKGKQDPTSAHCKAAFAHQAKENSPDTQSNGSSGRAFTHHKHDAVPHSVKIKLKPGHYKLNVELDSDSNPLRIKLTPQNSQEYEKELAKEQEPLFYCDNERPSRSLLPRRIQKLFRHSQPKPHRSHQQKHNAHFRPRETSRYGYGRNYAHAHHVPHHISVHKSQQPHHHRHHSQPPTLKEPSTVPHIPITVEPSSSETDDTPGDKPNENLHDENLLHVPTLNLGSVEGSKQETPSKFDEIEDFAPCIEQDGLPFSPHPAMLSDLTEKCDNQNSTKILANELSVHNETAEPHCESPPLSFQSGLTTKQSSKDQKKLFMKGSRHQRKSKYRLAERKKAEGNTSYRNKNYREALQLYTEAINLCPDCASYYSNRSACHMMLGKYAAALVDAREAVRLDPGFVKGYIRVAKCNIALGDANAALSVLRRAAELDASNKSLEDESNTAQQLLKSQDEVAKAASKCDYRTAIFHLDRALDLAVGCSHLKILKAEYLAYLQRYGDSQEIANEIIQLDNGNVDALFVRGLCLYYQDNCEQAFNHFQHVLRLAPDHKKAKEAYKKAKLLRQKKEEGNLAFNKGQLTEALSLYSEALEIDPNNRNTRSKLYFNRATVRSKLNKMEEAVEDCTAAINLDESYLKAYLRRAKCYQELEKHDEAVRDYDKVFKMDKNPEHKRLLQEAKIQQKRAKRKDYYKILGVDKTATDDEIKKSYRKKALQFHPDRHASASEKEKRDTELKFKEVGEAYTVLTDPKKRTMYDRGQDINDPDAGFFHEDVDPNQLFQTLFSTGPFGGSFGHSNFGGFGQHGAGFSGANFPGGFHFQFG